MAQDLTLFDTISRRLRGLERIRPPRTSQITHAVAILVAACASPNRHALASLVRAKPPPLPSRPAWDVLPRFVAVSLQARPPRSRSKPHSTNMVTPPRTRATRTKRPEPQSSQRPRPLPSPVYQAPHPRDQAVTAPDPARNPILRSPPSTTRLEPEWNPKSKVTSNVPLSSEQNCSRAVESGFQVSMQNIKRLRPSSSA